MWQGGSESADEPGSFGSKGVPAPSNSPASRYGAGLARDSKGRLWLFGGNRLVGSAAEPSNDLWRFEANVWTWVGGSNTTLAAGVHGTRGVAAPANVPGARQYPCTWVDGQDNLWVFGGWGRDADGDKTRWLNDLWRYDGQLWTWVAGSDQNDQPAVYGTQGTPAAGNTPGGRDGASCVFDGKQLWLYGGKGYAGTPGAEGYLSDLWRFDGTAWTWLGGNQKVNFGPSHGTLGTPAAGNAPGSRAWSCAWHDGAALWLFGGEGFDSTGTGGMLSDLWRLDGATKLWTWVAGPNTRNQMGSYGTLGTPAASNQPPARFKAGCWTDAQGRLWLLAGATPATQPYGFRNDLWRFDGKLWTWVGGSDKQDPAGIDATSPWPGGRSALSVAAAGPAAFVFGGAGLDGQGAAGLLNDLWLLVP